MLVSGISSNFTPLKSSTHGLKLNGSLYKNTKASASKQDLIDSLNQRKDDINKQKSEFRQNAVKQGMSQDAIDAKMDEYDGMIAKINSQISQIQQEKQKKSDKSANNTNNSTNTNVASAKTDEQKNAKTEKAQQSQMIGLASVQSSMSAIKAVKSAKRILKTEELVHAPSFAYKGDAAKAGALSSRADELDSKIAHINGKMQSAAKKVAENSPKTYREAAAENYQKIADSANQDEPENRVDVLA